MGLRTPHFPSCLTEISLPDTYISLHVCLFLYYYFLLPLIASYSLFLSNVALFENVL